MFNDTICTYESQYMVGLYTVIAYAPLAAIYVLVAVLFIKHPNAFHPLFVLSFFLILLAYTTAHFILFLRNLIEFFIDRNILFDIMEYIFAYSTYYTQPIIVLALLERLAATVWVSHYEKSCHWVPYTMCQALCIAFVALMSLYSKQEKIIGRIQFILSFVTCICLIILFFVNRNKTINANSKLSLTTRYQLAENIKALRLFVPFLVLDNAISIMFAITSILMDVDRKFDEPECMRGNNYVTKFLIFRTIAILMQISMATLVIYQHQSLKFWRKCRCIKRVNRTEETSLSVQKSEHRIQIKNVLGKNISEQETAENYFSQLRDQWRK